MRARALGALLVVFGPACSGGGSGDADRRPAKAADAAPAKRPAPPARAPGPERYRGTFEGRTEPTPAPLPSRNVAPNTPAPDAGAAAQLWTGRGTLEFEAAGQSVTGTLAGGGLSCKVGGTLVAGKLRAWLASEGAVGSRFMGELEGAPDQEAIEGSWRVSSSGGVEVRAGTFEARKAP